MTQRYIHRGDVIDWTNATGSAVAAGQVVVIAQILGVYTCPKVSAAVIAAGQTLTWDVSAGEFDDNAAVAEEGDITGPPATAFEAGVDTQTTLKVLFTGVAGDVEPAPEPEEP
jgi:predicted RecA/RadA family phage recombinase